MITSLTKRESAVMDAMKRLEQTHVASVKRAFLDKKMIKEGSGMITPLTRAVRRRNLELVQWMVENKADLEQRNEIGTTTALHEACYASWKDGTDYLLKCRANVNALTAGGSSPLMIGVTKCHTYDLGLNRIQDSSVVDLLLDHKADPSLERDGKRAMDIALEENCDLSVVEKLRGPAAAPAPPVAPPANLPALVATA
jgi:ankyrin repeat protein